MFKYLIFCLLLADSLCAKPDKNQSSLYDKNHPRKNEFIARIWENEDGTYSFQEFGYNFLHQTGHVFQFENPNHSDDCPCHILLRGTQ